MRIQFVFVNPAVAFPDGNRLYECHLPTPPRVGDYITLDPEGGHTAKVEVVTWAIPGSTPQPGFQPAIPRGPIGPDVYVVLRAI